MPPSRTLWDRFWSRVARPTAPMNCWRWTGTLNQKGYGVITDGRKRLMAHRVAYEWLVGPIPEGLTIDHLCRVRNCVNPKHMEPVTQRENVLRGDTYPARNAAKSHCPNGHPYDEVRASGERRCSICRRDQQNADRSEARRDRNRRYHAAHAEAIRARKRDRYWDARLADLP